MGRNEWKKQEKLQGNLVTVVFLPSAGKGFLMSQCVTACKNTDMQVPVILVILWDCCLKRTKGVLKKSILQTKFPFIFLWENMLLFLVWCTTKDNTPWDSPAASCTSVKGQGQSAGVKLQRFAPNLGENSPSQYRTGPAGPSQAKQIFSIKQQHFCPVRAHTSRKVM